VTCLGWGPDFRRGSVVQEEVGVVDVAPTVCELFGAKARFARGKRLPGLFA
jgi:arylsulfatase A-like enzyme